jgi:hypothetical protein
MYKNAGPFSGSFSNGRFVLSPLDIGYQCSMRFHFRIRKIEIRGTVLFIPDKILTPQFKEPVMNHSIVMNPNGSYMSMYILIPYSLCSVADVLQVAKLGNPYHPGFKKSPDHYLIVVCNMKILIMTPYRFIKRLPPSPYMVRG